MIGTPSSYEKIVYSQRESWRDAHLVEAFTMANLTIQFPILRRSTGSTDTAVDRNDT